MHAKPTSNDGVIYQLLLDNHILIYCDRHPSGVIYQLLIDNHIPDVLWQAPIWRDLPTVNNHISDVLWQTPIWRDIYTSYL